MIEQLGKDQVAEIVEKKGRKGGMNRPRSAKMRAFLNKHRQLGAPGFKRMRKTGKMALLQAQVNIMQQVIREAATMTARANVIIQDLIKESNFAVSEKGIEWVGDDQVLQKAEAYLKQFTASTPAPAPQSPAPLPTDSAHA